MLKDASGDNGAPSSLEVPHLLRVWVEAFPRKIHNVLEKKQVWVQLQPQKY
jgi:hypothetical protein